MHSLILFVSVEAVSLTRKLWMLMKRASAKDWDVSQPCPSAIPLKPLELLLSSQLWTFLDDCCPHTNLATILGKPPRQSLPIRWDSNKKLEDMNQLKTLQPPSIILPTSLRNTEQYRQSRSSWQDVTGTLGLQSISQPCWIRFQVILK